MEKEAHGHWTISKFSIDDGIQYGRNHRVQPRNDIHSFCQEHVLGALEGEAADVF